jgi:hypothetical protein
MTYTIDDSRTLLNFLTTFFRSSGQEFPHKDVMKYSSLMFIKEIEEDTTNMLTNANLLLDAINRGRANPYPQYTLQELDTMTKTVYDSGESTLSTRDRLFLRVLVVYSLSQITDIPYVITYNSDGVPEYYDTVIKESGKTTKEVLLYAFKLSNMAANSTTDNTLDGLDYTYLNSFIPARLSPNYNATTLAAALTPQTLNTDPLLVRFVQLFTLGPAYIAKIAETKWKLDLTWTVPA